MDSAISLPAEIRLQLVAEGAANIIYRIILPENKQDPPVSSDLSFDIPGDSVHTPPPTEVELPQFETADIQLDGKLLRLRKALPWISPTTTLHNEIHSTISPLFETSQLVAHDLVALPGGLIAACNAELRSSEHTGTRPKKRHSVYLEEDEQYGMLVTDMTANVDRGEELVEVKLKWLVQSPTAPDGSIRCRTCALRDMRKAMSRSDGAGHAASQEFCPLALRNAEGAVLEKAVSSLLAASDNLGERYDAVRRRLADFFESTPIIPRLAKLQRELDPAGVLHSSCITRDVCIAMTLRDCTLFLKIPRNENEPIEARLGDLDIKNADAGKLEYWQEVERDLIQGGWYEGRQPVQRKSVCRLSR